MLSCASQMLKSVIRKLERQQREIKELIATLRQIDSAISLKVSPKALSVDHFEKRLLKKALERSKGNQSEAARILQMSRDKLRYKMQKHGLK